MKAHLDGRDGADSNNENVTRRVISACTLLTSECLWFSSTDTKIGPFLKSELSMFWHKDSGSGLVYWTQA